MESATFQIGLLLTVRDDNLILKALGTFQFSSHYNELSYFMYRTVS